MYFYKFGYYTCEESADHVMFHSDKFTKEQLDQITEDGYIHAYKEYKIWFSEEKSFFIESGVTFQQLFSDRFLDYIKSLGFQEVQFESDSWVFGWAKADVEDWRSHTDGLTEQIQNKIIAIGRN